jgi:hypothetical protein
MFNLICPKRASMVIAISVLVLMTGYINAGGQRENNTLTLLDNANKLIEDKDYNAAIILLTEIARDDPEAFEETTNLIEKIREIKSEYNRKYGELIEVLFEQNDLENGLRIIKELQVLDPNPNQATLEAIGKAKKGAELVYNLNRFNGIMDRALSLIKESNFIEAVAIYISGYDLHKEDFDQAGYGNIIEASVNQSLALLSGAAQTFRATAGTLGTEINNIKIEVFPVDGMDIAGVDEKIRGLHDKLIHMIDLNKTVENEASNLKSQNSHIREVSSEGKYDLFLHFAGQLALGRYASEEQEGIAAAIEIMWEDFLLSLNNKIDRAASELYAGGLADYRNSSFTAAQSAMEGANRIYSLALDSYSLWGFNIKVDPAMSLQEASTTLPQNKLKYFAAAHVRIIETRDFPSLIDTRRELNNIVLKTFNTREDFALELENLESYKGVLQGKVTDWKVSLNEIDGIIQLGFDLTEAKSSAERMIGEIETLISKLNGADVTIISTAMAADAAAAEQRYNSSRVKLAEGVGLAEGREVVVEESTRLEKYPNLALEIFNQVADEVSLLEKSIEQLRAWAESDKAYILASDEVQQQLKRVDIFQDNLEKMKLALLQHQAEAQNNLLLAQRFEREGNLREEQARAGLRQDNFDQARENIQGALEAFDRSLEYREDEDIRRRRDQVLPALSQEIIEAENSVVVRQVRTLINRGRSLYNNSQFIDAERVLLQAKSRWADTNTEENSEVMLWLNFVRAALRANSGREIAESDPLFREISQLLNLAVEDYQGGKSLLEHGKVRDAIDRLERAEEKIARILIPFPYNQEARILSLRIDQLKDKDAFAEKLTLYYNDARRKISTNPQEAYVDLKDLEQINPDYPGLKRSIYDLEIILKIRIPPPDPAKLAESRELFNKARVIVERNQRELFTIALEQLNRAIELNPDNQAAIEYKDRIQIAAGERVQPILDSVAQGQYRLAEEKFLAGNYFEALAIVEKLLQYEKNKNYPPLIELKKRIETRI